MQACEQLFVVYNDTVLYLVAVSVQTAINLKNIQKGYKQSILPLEVCINIIKDNENSISYHSAEKLVTNSDTTDTM